MGFLKDEETRCVCNTTPRPPYWIFFSCKKPNNKKLTKHVKDLTILFFAVGFPPVTICFVILFLQLMWYKKVKKKKNAKKKRQLLAQIDTSGHALTPALTHWRHNRRNSMPNFNIFEGKKGNCFERNNNEIIKKKNDKKLLFLFLKTQSWKIQIKNN